MLLKKNKDPCIQCLVKPMCSRSCEREYYFIKTKLERMKRLQRYLPVMTFLLTLLTYAVLVSSGVERFYLGFSMIIIIVILCGGGLFIDLRYCDRRIFNLNRILFSIEIDMRHV